MNQFSFGSMGYADDCNFLIIADTIAEAEQNTKTIFDKISIWTMKNNLCINILKTQCVLFKTTKSNTQTN